MSVFHCVAFDFLLDKQMHHFIFPLESCQNKVQERQYRVWFGTQDKEVSKWFLWCRVWALGRFGVFLFHIGFAQLVEGRKLLQPLQGNSNWSSDLYKLCHQCSMGENNVDSQINCWHGQSVLNAGFSQFQGSQHWLLCLITCMPNTWGLICISSEVYLGLLTRTMISISGVYLVYFGSTLSVFFLLER